MNRKVLSMTALAVMTGVVVSACGGGGSNTQQPGGTNPAPVVDAGTPVKGGTYTTATTADATILNPILYQDATTGGMLGYMFEPLLKINDKWERIPALAEATPNIEENGLKWTFQLRKGVKWHDGAPFTAKDVKFTYTAVLHPGYTGVRASTIAGTNLKGAAALRAKYKEIDTANGDNKDAAMTAKVAEWDKWVASDALEIKDDHTIIVRFDKQNATAMNSLAGFLIIPEHKLKDELGAKMKDSAFNASPIGTGKFKFGEWKKGERLVLKANDDWWGGRPYIDEYVLRVFPDINTAMAALEKGEIDSSSVDVEQFDRFKADVQIVNLYEYSNTSYRHIVLDHKNELFQDKNVRLALAHAFDKEMLVKQILQGHGIAAWSHGTPSRWDFNGNVFKPAFDKKKAEELLDAAGWTKGSDGIREKNGKKFAFEFNFVSNSKLDSEAAQVVQAAWKEIGVDANLKGLEFATILDLSDAGNPNRKQPPAYILGWSLGSEPDATSIWACDGSFNDPSYCNKEVDELLAKGRTELDQNKRKEIYAQFQAKLAEDQAAIFLWFPNSVFGINKRVKGPIAGTPIGIEHNIEKWYIEGGK